MKKKLLYTEPTIELLEVEIEQGIANTSLENPEEGGEIPFFMELE